MEDDYIKSQKSAMDRMNEMIIEAGGNPDDVQSIDFDIEAFENEMEEIRRESRRAAGEAILAAQRTILTD